MRGIDNIQCTQQFYGFCSFFRRTFFENADQFQVFALQEKLQDHGIADHHPDHAIRFSKRGYRKDGYITNLPLYLARKTKDLL